MLEKIKKNIKTVVIVMVVPVILITAGIISIVRVEKAMKKCFG